MFGEDLLVLTGSLDSKFAEVIPVQCTGSVSWHVIYRNFDREELMPVIK